MSAIVYTVTATFADVPTRAEYVAWLQDGHVQEVVRAGAKSARVQVVTDPCEPLRVDSVYEFASMEAMDHYVREFAPALRAEGLARFGGRGVTFQRVVSTLVFAQGMAP